MFVHGSAGGVQPDRRAAGSGGARRLKTRGRSDARKQGGGWRLVSTIVFVRGQ